ncbi:MAG TPA: DUF4276 family protein [Longimicrobium sp.]|nr:DUF4276 family protein [Longimicrobium sp.]
MRIGFVVDGRAEYESLADVLLKVDTRHTLVTRILRADLQPSAPLGQIALEASKRIRDLVVSRQVQRAVVLIDREQNPSCCGEYARDLAAAITKQCQGKGLGVEIQVVVKDRMYENWLVADPVAFDQLSARFDPSTIQKGVGRHGADGDKALALLKRAAVKKQFDKVPDAARITQHLDPLRMGEHSRSFRKLLGVVGCSAYTAQTKRPASQI